MAHNLLIVTGPLVLAGLAAAAWWVMRQRRTNAASGPSIAARPGTAALSDVEFEALVTQAFQRQGYQVVDGGAHTRALMLRRHRETFLVQCRHRHEAKVGVDAVQALHQQMTAHGANGGFVLTEGRFSREATTFAAGCQVRLLEGAALQGLLDPVRAGHRA